MDNVLNCWDIIRNMITKHRNLEVTIGTKKIVSIDQNAILVSVTCNLRFSSKYNEIYFLR